MRCKFCGSEDDDCEWWCECAKCRNPEAYEDWKENNPEQYDRWLEKQEEEI